MMPPLFSYTVFTAAFGVYFWDSSFKEIMVLGSVRQKDCGVSNSHEA